MHEGAGGGRWRETSCFYFFTIREEWRGDEDFVNLFFDM